MLSIVRITVLSLLLSVFCQSISATSNRNNSVEVEREDKDIRIRRPSLSLELNDVYNSSIPTGSVISFAGDKAPQGWLLCDGQQCSSQKYPQLYSVIGMNYVPQDSWIHQANKHAQSEQFFCVPDMRGRTVVGVDSNANRVMTNNTLGASGSEEKHLLSIGEMASHDHQIQCRPQTQSGGSYPHDIIVPGITQNVTVSRTTNNSGNDQPHNNMQPYLVLNYIIKTGKEESDGQRNKTAQQDIEFDNQHTKIAQLEQELNNLKIASAKAWIVFDGTNTTILNSYGVSSLVKNAIGNYTISFIKPFSSENYCFSLNSGNATDSGGIHALGPFYNQPTKTCFNFLTCDFHGTTCDASYISACFYGD